MKRILKIFDVYLILFFGLVIGLSIAYLIEKKANVWYIIPAIMYIVVIYLVSVYGRFKHFGFYLFLFALVTKIITALAIDTPPISDFKMMIDAAKAFAVGDYSFKENGYFSAWSYQTGFVVYQGLIVKLFGYHLILMKLINCLWIALTSVLVYMIGKRLLNDVAARGAALIHATYIPLFLYAPVLTNQHIATFFYYLAFFFVVRKEEGRYGKWIYAGIAFALGNVMRPIGIIWLAAIGIWAIVSLFVSAHRQRDRWCHMKRFGTCLIVYLITFYGIAILLTSIGVTDTGLSNNNPYWKFVVGFNEDTKGVYSFEDVKILVGQELDEVLFEKEKAIIRERLSIPPYRLGWLMIDKVESMWGSYESGVFTFPHMLGKDMKRFGREVDNLYLEMIMLEKMIYIPIILLVFYGLIIQLVKAYRSKYRIIYYMLTMYTGIHFLIEVSFRYKYGVMGLVFILAGNGIRYLYNSRE